jgi:hypothetical protein
MTSMTKSLRLRSLALTLALVGTAVAFVVTTAASGAPAGGAIRVLSTGSGTGTGGKVLVTGAIGDAGTTLTINKAGKPTSNGGYVKLTLTKGTFELNIAKINASANKMFSSAKPNPATCSIGVVFGGPATLLDGTGLYQNVTGTVRFTISVGLIFPRLTSGARKGQCNLSNSARPTASVQLIEGTGTVTFA